MTGGYSRRDVGKEQFWRDRIGEQPGSGLSIRGYCRGHRLRESAFYFWRRTLAGRAAAGKRKTAFVPVRVTRDGAANTERAELVTGPSGSLIEIVLSGGWRVRLVGSVDRQALGDVLAVLSAGQAADGGAGRHAFAPWPSLRSLEDGAAMEAKPC